MSTRTTNSSANLECPLHLIYRRNGQPVSIPDWTRFFLNLGWAIALQPKPASYIRVVVSVPIRTLSSPLVALGIVLGRATCMFTTKDQTTHFEYLCDLPCGTKLSFIKGSDNRRVTGISLGCDTINGEKRLSIQTKSGDTYKKPAHLASSIYVASIDAPLTGLNGRKMSTPTANTLSFLPSSSYDEYLLLARLDCLIVGPKNLITSETTENEYSLPIKPSSMFSLSDLLRIRSFQSPGASFRTDVIASSTPSDRVPSEQPFAAILDGPSAFRRFHNRHKKGHRIVILERTAPRVEDCVDFIKSEYIQSRIDTEAHSLLQAPPLGIEMLSYEVKA